MNGFVVLDVNPTSKEVLFGFLAVLEFKGTIVRFSQCLLAGLYAEGLIFRSLRSVAFSRI